MILGHPDIVFFHPPSIYDFRERSDVLGPISDVIPSTQVFEMYPVGLTSIADYLEEHGYHAQIINLAYQMLNDPDYDPDREIETADSWAFGIDLHWLPHADGVIEVARRIKRYHPGAPVILGGLSATYYHDELVEYPCIDYVIRGDSTEEPMRQLLDALDGDGDLDSVENLTYRRDGETVVNPLSFQPETLDYAAIPSYTYTIRSVFKYGSLRKITPHRGWWDETTTMLLTARGCRHSCAFCGGANAYQDVCARTGPAFRSPEKLIEDIRTITSFSSGPIFVVHDLRMGGRDYAREFFERLSKEDIDNEFVFELFGPATEDYFEVIDASVDRYNLELSPESHVEEIRAKLGKFAVSNESIESTIEYALDNGCRTIDIFYMIGLPEQTYEDAVGCVDYAETLLERFEDGRIRPFVAPLSPFLDPGSPAFENPEEYGYTLHAESFEDHRKALQGPSWKHMLTYETEHLSRDDIVDATYEAGRRMNDLKFEHGLVTEETHHKIEHNLDVSERIIEEIDQVMDRPEPERGRKIKEIVGDSSDFYENSICGEDELSWSSQGLRDVFSILRLATKVILHDITNRVKRRRSINQGH
ncbi:MAG: TIGR04190 family B12-binding domain/radical SAM domain protein [Halodesulfurarchaeum sp.]